MSESAAPTRAINPWLIAPVVALAAFMEVLDISIANVALPHIAGSLSASADESAWVLTSYLVTNAVSMPISGWLSTVVGRKRYFMICIVGFTVASLACGLAPSLGTLVLVRALQGAAGGGLQPGAQAILTDAFPQEKRGMAFALYGVAVVFAPAIGPTLGGWITDTISWRWVFLLNVPVGALLVVLVNLLVRDPQALVAERSRRLAGGLKFDGVGFGLLALGIGALQIVLDRGQQDDWFASPLILVMSLASGLSLIALVIWEVTAEHPIVDLKLLRDRTFAVSSVLMFFLGFILLGSTYLIPAFVQDLLGYTATDAGLVLTPGAVFLILMMPLVGRMQARVDVRWMIAFGLVTAGGALLWLARFDLTIDYGHIMLARIIQSIGLGFLFVPINTVAFSSLAEDKTSNASGLINLWRNLGGSVGISLASSLLARRAQLHQADLGPAFSLAHRPFDETYHRLAAYLSHLAQAGGGDRSLAALYQSLYAQARLMSYLDGFELFGLIFIAAVAVLLIMPRPKLSGGAAPVG